MTGETSTFSRQLLLQCRGRCLHVVRGEEATRLISRIHHPIEPEDYPDEDYEENYRRKEEIRVGAWHFQVQRVQHRGETSETDVMDSQ